MLKPNAFSAEKTEKPALRMFIIKSKKQEQIAGK
jgi:hypothetical protein